MYIHGLFNFQWKRKIDGASDMTGGRGLGLAGPQRASEQAID